jgi:murein DD-endopeptidase MepM/ murein hydrolase activator NlpD
LGKACISRNTRTKTSLFRGGCEHATLTAFGEDRSIKSVEKGLILVVLTDERGPVPARRRPLTKAGAVAFGAAFTLFSSVCAPAFADERSSEHEAFAAVATSAPQVERRTIAIRAGETLEQALVRVGALRDDAVGAIRSMARAFDPRDVRRDDQVTVFLQRGQDGTRLAGFNLANGAERSLTVTRGVDNVFRTRDLATNLQRTTQRVAGVLTDTGLLAAVREAGAPDRAADAIAGAFAYDVDFERDIGAGAEFELVYERVADGRGAVVRDGEPVFARLTTSTGRSIQLYRFQPPGAARSEWYDANGRTARRFLMRTPVNGARLTSGFGYRRHPVLGYSKMHTGVDFGAPVGTPILAAGDGVVTRASYFGAYGNTVDIDHGGGWSTRYAHISRFAANLRVGDRVSQGEVIAAVGNTGRSTGPHLHYEIRRDGTAINPQGVGVPTGQALAGDALTRFNAHRARVDGVRRNAVGGAAIAQTATPGQTRALN